MLVKLLGYAPDADQTIIGVLTSCSGVIPSIRGMKSAPAPADTPLATLGATCQGAMLVTLLDSSTRLFAGTPTDVLEAGASTWSSVGYTSYTTTNTAKWRFAQQGNVTIATNNAETLQASVSSGAFTTISGAPIASIVEVVGQFVFAFNTSTATNQWRCSALGDYTDWAASIASQSASGNLIDTPGPINGAKRFGDSVIVFKKNSMYRGRYVGAPNIWEFDLIPGEAGAMSQESIVDIGTPDSPKLLFMGEGNFYTFDGSRPIPIAINRVNQSVFNSINQTRYYACQAQHDPNSAIVRFWYPVADSVFPDKCVVYNYRSDRWGVDDRQIASATQYVPAAITYATLGSFYATYQVLPNLPYGSAFLGSSVKQPAIIDTANRLRTLSGEAGVTSLTTGDIGDDVSFNVLTRVRPRFLASPTSASITNYYKNNSGDSLTADSQVSLSDGSFDVLREARWHRIQMNFVGDWEMAGFSAEYEGAGLE